MHLWLMLMLGLWLVFATTNSHSHENQFAQAQITVKPDNSLQLQLSLSIENAILALDGQHNAEHSDEFTQLARLSPAALTELFLQRLDRFNNQLTVNLGNQQEVDLTLDELVIPPNGKPGEDRISTLHFSSAPVDASALLSISWSLPTGPLIARVDDTSTGELLSAYLEPGQSSSQFSLSAPSSSHSLFTLMGDYLIIGFNHIIPDGWDHIVFIVGLFLLSTAWRPLLVQASVFTLAHSLTLVLALMNVVSVSAALVEPLIALSIVVLAVENIRHSGLHPQRLLIIFAFGLLHGLGFAGSIGAIDYSGSHFLAALISFNIGIELGQLGVVALCMLTVGFWFGTRSWYHRIIRVPGSVIIGATGSIWFLQRVIG